MLKILFLVDVITVIAFVSYSTKPMLLSCNMLLKRSMGGKPELLNKQFAILLLKIFWGIPLLYKLLNLYL